MATIHMTKVFAVFKQHHSTFGVIVLLDVHSFLPLMNTVVVIWKHHAFFISLQYICIMDVQVIVAYCERASSTCSYSANAHCHMYALFPNV